MFRRKNVNESETVTLDELNNLLTLNDKKREEFASRHPILNRLRNAWLRFRNPGPIWWLKYRLVPSHQYHIIRTGLPPGYHDTGTRLLYGILKELEEWANIDHHLDGAIVSGRISPATSKMGQINTEDEEDSEEIYQYYLSRKTMLDELREAYRWWIMTGRDPERYIQEQAFRNGHYDMELETRLTEQAARMLENVVRNYRTLWN